MSVPPDHPFAPVAIAGGPALLDVAAMRLHHIAFGHTVQLDLQKRRPGGLAALARDYNNDAVDLLQRGRADRERARTKLVRSAAFLLAEIDRIDAEEAAERT